MHEERCAFCEAVAASSEEACDDGWVPDFWIGDYSIHQAVCPKCQFHLHVNEDGERDHIGRFTGDLIRYEFHWQEPEGVCHEDSFDFLREPGQNLIDYLAAHRPGCTITRQTIFVATPAD